jgi:hypothetical protein
MWHEKSSKSSTQLGPHMAAIDENGQALLATFHPQIAAAL